MRVVWAHECVGTSLCVVRVTAYNVLDASEPPPPVDCVVVMKDMGVSLDDGSPASLALASMEESAVATARSTATSGSFDEPGRGNTAATAVFETPHLRVPLQSSPHERQRVDPAV